MEKGIVIGGILLMIARTPALLTNAFYKRNAHARANPHVGTEKED
jgi:hypothetical protein